MIARLPPVVVLLILNAIVLVPTAQARYSALVVDADTGEVLYECNANDYRYPASLTKMMTLYMVFDALEQGRLRLGQPLWVSGYAASRPPMKLGLRPGDAITVEEAVYSLVTLSANDVASVVAEALGRSEFVFAQQMTRKARQLGMLHTNFSNASGLPDPFQVTTAWDMFKLAQALQRDFPTYYRYFATTDFYYRQRIHRNHNRLLYDYEGTDGIKTGYTRGSGYNLVASVRRGGHHVIGIVFGGNSGYARDTHMRAILDQGFAKLEYGTPVYVEPPPFLMARAIEEGEEPPSRSEPNDSVTRYRALEQFDDEGLTRQARPSRQVKSVSKKALAKREVRQVQLAKRGGPSRSIKLVQSTERVERGKASRAQLARQTRKSTPLQLAKRTEPTRVVKQGSGGRAVEPAKSKLVKRSEAVKPIGAAKPAKPVRPATKPTKSSKPVKQAGADPTRNRLLARQ